MMQNPSTPPDHVNDLPTEYALDSKPRLPPACFTPYHQTHIPSFHQTPAYAPLAMTDDSAFFTVPTDMPEPPFSLTELSKDANSEEMNFMRLIKRLTENPPTEDIAETQPHDSPRLPPAANARHRRFSFEVGGGECHYSSSGVYDDQCELPPPKGLAFPSLNCPSPVASGNRAIPNSPQSKTLLSVQASNSFLEGTFPSLSPASRLSHFGGRPASASCSTTTSTPPPRSDPRMPTVLNDVQFEHMFMKIIGSGYGGGTNASAPLPNTAGNTTYPSPSTPSTTLASSVNALSPNRAILMTPTAGKLSVASTFDDSIDPPDVHSFDSTTSLKFANVAARLSHCSNQAGSSFNIDADALTADFLSQRPVDKRRFFVKILVSEELADLAFQTRAQELNKLKEESQTEVELSPDGHYFPGTQKRPVAISGAVETGVYEVLDFFLTLILQQAQSGSPCLAKSPGGSSGLAKARCAIAVPRIVIGSLIGKHGSYIQSVRMSTGAHVYVSPLFVRADEACSERLVTISSRDRGSLRAATFTISRKINEHMANSSCRSVMYRRKHVPSVPDFSRVNSSSSSELTPSIKGRLASCSFDIDVGGHVDLAAGHHPQSKPLLEQFGQTRGVYGRRLANSFDCSTNTDVNSAFWDQLNKGSG